MERYIPVMEQSLNLMETVMEGLHHIYHKLNEGKLEQTFFLFGDVIMAIQTIQSSLGPMQEIVDFEHDDQLYARIQTALDHAVQGYENRNSGQVLEVLQFALIPAIKKWQAGLETSFQKYLIS